jgi:hypothetical protein
MRFSKIKSQSCKSHNEQNCAPRRFHQYTEPLKEAVVATAQASAETRANGKAKGNYTTTSNINSTDILGPRQQPSEYQSLNPGGVYVGLLNLSFCNILPNPFSLLFLHTSQS